MALDSYQYITFDGKNYVISGNKVDVHTGKVSPLERASISIPVKELELLVRQRKKGIASRIRIEGGSKYENSKSEKTA